MDLDAAAGALDAAADALYALAREEFTPARDERVRDAKAAGDRSLAGQLGKLRKPTVAAWLVNTLARRRPEELAELATLGERLRAAHEQLDGPALRRLSEQRRELVNALGRSIRELAGEDGEEVSDAVSRELDGMFATALADPAAARALASGRLSSPKELASAAALDWPAIAPGARPRPLPARPTDPPSGTAGGSRSADTGRGSATDPGGSSSGTAGAASAPTSPGPAAEPAPKPAAAREPTAAPPPPHTPPPAPKLALTRARHELERLATALAEAEERATTANHDHETAAAEEAAAHRAVADRRAELIAAEAAEQQARQRARAARRAREDTDRALRDAVRRHGVARDRLSALED